jgi:hypothetical protein
MAFKLIEAGSARADLAYIEAMNSHRPANYFCGFRHVAVETAG